MVSAGSVLEAAVADPFTATGVPPGPEEMATIEVTAVETATVTALWLLAIVTGAELAMVAWPLALTLFGEIETTRPAMLDVAEEAAPVNAATRVVLPFEIGAPSSSRLSMVETVPVPLDGTPEVMPTLVRLAMG